MKKPLLLIVSATIRRDLHRPFRRFTRFRVVHAYMDASYGDMDKADFVGTRQIRSARELAALLEELQPDLVQAPEPVANRAMLKASWVIWRWHKRTRRPYFFPMFENLSLSHKFGPAVGWLMGQWLARFARDARWIYVLHSAARKTLADLGIRGDKVIRANWGNWGIDRQEFHPASNPAKARASAPTILFVGRLSAAKGVDDLLTAFSMVRVALPSAELWMVGPTDLDRGNAALVERTKAIAGAELFGSKKQRELPALFQQAWVTVLFSKTTKRWAEQVGMVNLQSLACGTPVVTTNSGSIGEYVVVGHGALLVEEGDAVGAGAEILGVLQNSKRRENMGSAGVDWIAHTFDEAANVPRLEALTFERWQQATRPVPN